MNRAEIIVCLKIIAAKAEQLANDVVNHKLWGGELYAGLNEIGAQLERAKRQAKDDEHDLN